MHTLYFRTQCFFVQTYTHNQCYIHGNTDLTSLYHLDQTRRSMAVMLIRHNRYYRRRHQMGPSVTNVINVPCHDSERTTVPQCTITRTQKRRQLRQLHWSVSVITHFIIHTSASPPQCLVWKHPVLTFVLGPIIRYNQALNESPSAGAQ